MKIGFDKLKKYSLAYVFTALLLCLIVFAVEYNAKKDVAVYEGTDSEIPFLSYDKGIYEITVLYKTDGYAMLRIDGDESDPLWSARSVNTLLPPYRSVVTSDIYVSDNDSSVGCVIYPVSDDTSLSILNVSIIRKRMQSATYGALKIFAFLAVLYAALFLVYLANNTTEKERKLTVGILFFISFLSIFAFLQSYIPGGQDAEFHIARIAGLSDGLRSGQFPVRMYQHFANDYGYPLGIMYGDLFMYPSAILHLLGVPLWKSYAIYVMLISFLTAYLSYYSFKEISKDRFIGCMGSAIYTLSLWRLNDVYLRAAVGEYTAMTFLPLLLLAFFKLFSINDNDDDSETECRKITLWFIIGYTGIIQSHILTSIMFTVFIIPVCLLLWKKVLVGQKIVTLIRSAIAVLLLNAGFIVPMIDYYSAHDFALEHQSTTIQEHGAYLSQILSNTGNFIGGSISVKNSELINENMPLSIGISMIMILFAAVIYLIAEERREDNRHFRVSVAIASGISILAIWMSTCSFPYDLISEKMHFLARILNRVQFPWRYLVIATLAVTLLAVLLLLYCKNSHPAFYKTVYIVLLTVTIWQGIEFVSERNRDNENPIDAMNVDQIAAPLIDNDTLYWLQGMNSEYLMNRDIYCSDMVQAAVIRDSVPNYDIALTNDSGKDIYIEPPVLAYKGYRAYSDNGRMELSSGDNYRIRVMIPAGFNGIVHIQYKEPLLWRLCEIVSLLTAIVIVTYFVLKHANSTIYCGLSEKKL